MSIETVLKAIESLPVPDAIRTSAYLFPGIETVHVVGVVFVIGSIAMVDLRLMNLVSKDKPVEDVIKGVLPWTWSAFALALISGSLLFSSNAVQYFGNGPFRIKFLLMMIAGFNMLLFHLFLHRRVLGLAASQPVPTGVRAAGAVSISLWIAIVFAGRWIGFVL